MDMQMPVMNGHEATKQIKATTRGQATVIIALTASAFEDQRDVILSEGCNDFIRKPFRENQVFGVMERHLGVEFVYEDLAAAPIAPAASQDVDVTAIAELPEVIRNSLRDATIAGDLDEILKTIESIRGIDSTTADSLASLAHEYDYQSILDRLSEVQS
jgi:CheY-like chemotaxis protein